MQREDQIYMFSEANRFRDYFNAKRHSRKRRTRKIFPIRKDDKNIDEGNNRGVEVQTAQCLNARMHKMGRDDNYIKVHTTQPTVYQTAQTGRNGKGVTKEYFYCLDTGNSQAVEVGSIVGFDGGQKFRNIKSELSPALMARAREDGSGQPVIKIENSQAVETKNKIRRLTPIECLRLQSFPDDWLDIERLSDAQKYKQCGNSITVNVLREIFKKII